MGVLPVAGQPGLLPQDYLNALRPHDRGARYTLPAAADPSHRRPPREPQTDDEHRAS